MESCPDCVAVKALYANRSEYELIDIGQQARNLKEFLALQLSSCFAMAGMKVELSGSYSGWQPNVNSPLLAALKKAYNDMFGKEPDVRVIHAGLECGIISTNYPKMDMVSFGPTLMSPHSPTERVEIPTVEKFYSLVKALVVNGVL